MNKLPVIGFVVFTLAGFSTCHGADVLYEQLIGTHFGKFLCFPQKTYLHNNAPVEHTNISILRTSNGAITLDLSTVIGGGNWVFDERGFKEYFFENMETVGNNIVINFEASTVEQKWVIDRIEETHYISVIRFKFSEKKLVGITHQKYNLDHVLIESLRVTNLVRHKVSSIGSVRPSLKEKILDT